MKILCVFGQHNYGQPARGESYEYVNFLPAFNRLGLEVVFFESWNRAHYDGFTELNRALLEKVEAECPDLVFCVLLGFEIWLETLEIIRRSGVTLLNWGTDDSWKYAQFSRFIAPAVDFYLTTSAAAFARAERDGLKNFQLSQWAASADALAAPCPAAECDYEVVFVGSAYGNRPRWIAQLRDSGIPVACFGHGWESGAVSTDAMRRILHRARIVLNFGDSGIQMKGLSFYHDRQIKARVFEVPGLGGFLMTESATHLDRYFAIDEELVVFADIADLAKKIRYYLAHPADRDHKALQGHLRVAREHTYDARFSAIFAAIRAKDVPLTLGRNGAIDWQRFQRAAEAHRPRPWMLSLKAAMLWICRKIWGEPRGARAARRILYELSWRLSGKKTFSAAGLPGRLFYSES